MDPAAKKRRSDDNGTAASSPAGVHLTPDDAAKILAPFTHEQLLDVVTSAFCRGDSAVLAEVRAVADRDPAQRKLFTRGLGWDATTDSLRSVFAPFGDIEEAVVINDKATGRSKGYGFVTFRHVDGALLALKEPSKNIGGRMTVTQLAAAGNSNNGGAGGPPAPAADLAQRKIFVGNVPADMSSDRLLAHFASYGEIEEGPLGFDKQTGKFRGFALFIYKTAEAAQASLVDPTKTIDGQHLVCKLASTDPRKGKPGAPGAAAPPAAAAAHQGQPAVPGNPDIAAVDGRLPSQFGFPGTGQSSFPSYGSTALPGAGGLSAAFPGAGGLSATIPGAGGPSATLPGAGGLSHNHSLNSSMQPYGAGNPGLSSTGSQVPSLLAGSGAGSYGGGLGGGPYGSSAQYEAPGSGGYGGLGMGSSMYRMPPSSGGMPSGGYPEGGQYPLPSSAYQSQQNKLPGSPGRRYPTGGGGMYPNLSPYF